MCSINDFDGTVVLCALILGQFHLGNCNSIKGLHENIIVNLLELRLVPLGSGSRHGATDRTGGGISATRSAYTAIGRHFMSIVQITASMCWRWLRDCSTRINALLASDHSDSADCDKRLSCAVSSSEPNQSITELQFLRVVFP